MAIIERRGDSSPVVVKDAQDGGMLTGEILLGNGMVGISPCSSGDSIGVQFVEHEEAHEIGVKDEPGSPLRHGSIVIWLGNEESAGVLKRIIDEAVKLINNEV